MKPPPWAWTRRQLAKVWNVPPWAVDRAPWREVVLELALMKAEREAQAVHAEKARRKSAPRKRIPRSG